MQWITPLIGIVILLVLAFSGIRIAFATITAGLIMLLLVYGSFSAAGAFLSSYFVHETSNYAVTVIPLFIFVGYLAYYYGMGEGIFKAARCWFGRLPGGLAIATVMGSAFFGAICGFSPAAVAMFGRLAIPEMEKSGYHWSLSVGSVAASGTLCELIPPSSLIIVYGILYL